MLEDKTIVIGDFIAHEQSEKLDLSSTLRLRARSINKDKLWASKDRSAEFMGDIWSLFVDTEKEKQIRTVLHSVCVELIENSVKYGCQDHDYIITTDLCLRRDELLVYVVNKSDLSVIPGLEIAARQVIDSDNIRTLFKQKMKEAKEAKKLGMNKSQLGFIRIVMQNVELAWQIKIGQGVAIITTLSRIPLKKKDV